MTPTAMTKDIAAPSQRVGRRTLLTLKPQAQAFSPPRLLDLTGEPVSVTATLPQRTRATETQTTRAVCFFDGQNLLRSAKHAFGHDHYVNPVALGEAVCAQQGWRCDGIRFYTGMPDPSLQPDESRLWSARCARLQAAGVSVYTRRLQYITRQHQVPNGSVLSTTKIKEKGIDMRMGLDVLELGLADVFDVAVLFCRDQDLSEVIPSIRRLGTMQSRRVRLASAYPTSADCHLTGIKGMQWIPIDEAMYGSCLDQHDIDCYTPS